MSNQSLQHDELDAQARRWVEKALGVGAKFVSAERLAGATSSVLDAVEVEQHGRRVSVVLRRFFDAEWLKLEPDLARHEASSLELASRAKIGTPQLIAFDERGEECGAPATLMSRLEGRVELLPENAESWLRQMAEALVAIHEVDPRGHAWTYYPYADIDTLQPPAWSAHPDLWEKALDMAAGRRPPARECFIHRDFHPVNVLWHEGRLSGVIDWVNACRGAAGFDVTWCKQNLALLRGVEWADGFLSAYQRLAGNQSEYHPFWDLMGLVEMLPGPPEVYPGWPAFGVRELTPRILHERAEQYLLSVMARL